MLTNQDRVSSILDEVQATNNPQAVSDGLTILSKLTANIISNPFQQKYRGIKISNNAIKSKIMNLKNIEKVLLQLGYVKEGDDMYVLKDERIGDFLEGTPAVEYKRRLTTARLSSQADYEKQLLLINLHKQQRVDAQKKEQEAQKLKEKCNYDQMERKHMKADQTKSNTLAFGTKTNTFKDIGVDLCAKKGG